MGNKKICYFIGEEDLIRSSGISLSPAFFFSSFLSFPSLLDPVYIDQATTINTVCPRPLPPSSSWSLLLPLLAVCLATPAVFVAARGCRCHCHHQQFSGDGAASREMISSSCHLSLAQLHHQPC